METLKNVSYEQWADLVMQVMNQGMAGEAFASLQEVYPYDVGSVYDSMIFNQLARLEEFLLKDSFRKFEKELNLCLEEVDLQILEKAVIKLRKRIQGSMFFWQIPEYPEFVKKNLSEAMEKNVQAYLAAFAKYVKKLEYADNSQFIQDVIYICKRKLLKIDVLGV